MVTQRNEGAVWEWGLQDAIQGYRLCRIKESLDASIGDGPGDQLVYSHFTGKENEI